MRTELDRRRLLMLGAGSLGALAMTSEDAAAQKGGRAAASKTAAPQRFFSPAEFKLVDELAEMIVPADENSGGARAAKVAAFIDKRLAESRDRDIRQSWKDDLAEIDTLSTAMFGRPFMAARPDQRTKLLERISRNEDNPKEAGEYAFGTIKWQVTYVYYKTRIGIHDELKYQGNTLLDTFVGTDPGRD
ncbi:MAG: gluconate 2-dehydrogenase subunit 3 family protein [Hyphomicrobiaceae bacterium]